MVSIDEKHLDYPMHKRPVEAFWRKVFLMAFVAQLQGPDPVSVSRVRIKRGNAKHENDKFADCNLPQRFQNFFNIAKADGETEPENALTDADALKAGFAGLIEKLKPEKNIEKDIFNKRAVTCLLGMPLKKHLPSAYYNEYQVWNTYLKGGVGTGLDEVLEVPANFLYRIAVAFGFCPPQPLTVIGDNSSDNWLKELAFNPESFDQWAKEGGGSAENSLACKLWQAFAGTHAAGTNSWGESFDDFFDRWCDRVFNDDEKLRAGVQVLNGHQLVVLRQYKKPKDDKTSEEQNAASKTPAKSTNARAETKEEFCLINGSTEFSLTMTGNNNINLEATLHDNWDELAFTGFEMVATSTDLDALEHVDNDTFNTVEGGKAMVRHKSDTTMRCVVVTYTNNSGISDGQVFETDPCTILRATASENAGYVIDYTVSVPNRRIVGKPQTGSNAPPDFPLARIRDILSKHDRFTGLSINAKEDLPNPIPLYEGRYIHEAEDK
ncbi:hypothetical protein SAMN04487859_12335 [Roseovarius lutimaris]|uniref:Uncharacterized protein n=1 Tax=Roseovarius lutimaris TaxID=1005928 RepID=A0A1I5G0L1_9RHOB|nr:hypothetical protein [Roseovarius lutimaris]SFO29091.1 hypothetical protein SAMN04487859_12335 [Roseovarius lutimaris]